MARRAISYRQASKKNYNIFCSTHPEIEIEFLEWANIIYTFNSNLRDYALETGMKVKFPHGFGEFTITKKIPKRKTISPDGKEHINLPVDWKKTKELGKKVYHFNFHTEGYKFRWKWFTRSARFTIHELWWFKPSRISSRLIKHYITERKGHHHKYHEWVK